MSVGDVVRVGIAVGVVTKISKYSNKCYVIWSDGSCGEWNIKKLSSTGKRMDVFNFLKGLNDG